MKVGSSRLCRSSAYFRKVPLTDLPGTDVKLAVGKMESLLRMTNTQ
jgi:hypothetical protein